ncbi:MAG TPA: TonB-dependent receptor [Steroidobacter sp.]|uniref:TonB-dependent receptor n=1 Tax=Steroidobacter sp. TaxID=1978227 RepID=UPI002EDBAE1A
MSVVTPRRSDRRDRRRKLRRHIVANTVAAVLFGAALGPAHAQMQAVSIATAAQPLASALEQLAKQTNTNILFRPDEVEGYEAPALNGNMTPRQAAERLLAGTPLRITQDESGSLIIRRDAAGADGVEGSGGDGLYIDEVVVTGTAERMSKFETSYAVSTIDEEQIQLLAPQSTADLIGKLPGFYVEASGGESNNNISPRGLPGSFGTRFIAIVEDGMLFFQDPNEIYLNGDSFARSDIMTERVEAVRSGAAPIFTSNAPAGVINTITRKGGDTPEGATRLTWQDSGMQRVDAYSSGPMGNDWYYAAGGFMRSHDGYRDPGFPTDEGGQFRLNLTKRFDGGEVTAYAKYIDETNVFYLPIPLKDPRDGSSLADLIDPLEGTMMSNANRHYIVKTFTGDQTDSIQRDIADGRHATVFMTGLDFTRDFGNGWNVSNKLRYLNANVDLDALFSTTQAFDYQSYAQSKLAAARAAFGPNVAALNYVLANDRGAGNSRIGWDPSGSRGLVIEQSYRYVPTEGSTVIDELQVTKDIGDHSLTAGLSYSQADLTHQRLLQDSLNEVGGLARRLDLLAVDAAGNVLGSVTDDGFLRYGSYYIGGTADSERYAIYLADSWKVTDAFTLDAGIRNEWYDQTGLRWLTETRNYGDPTTIADNAQQGNSGRTAVYRQKDDNLAWTLGANYEFNSEYAMFGRFTKAFRSRNLWAAVTNNNAPDDKITGAEIGLKYNTRPLSMFATAFYSDFDQLSVPGPTVNPITGVNESATYWGKLKVYGIETEMAWRPFRAFELAGNVTWQRPRQRELQEQTYGNLGDQFNGKLPARVPEWIARLTPTVFFDIGAVPTTLYANVSYAGRRYVDALNSTELPDYTTVDLGATAKIGDVHLQAVVTNLTNEEGVTEGNPRVDGLTGQGTDEVIFGRPIFGRTLRLVATWDF